MLLLQGNFHGGIDRASDGIARNDLRYRPPAAVVTPFWQRAWNFAQAVLAADRATSNFLSAATAAWAAVVVDDFQAPDDNTLAFRTAWNRQTLPIPSGARDG
ncbi:hypothetical protein [Planctellipticum variicoloris]|jgi:hypothetical protein|uniref:hypothetical protein n=1 Tax=Planctellipticum variicoloris TaxID=3064265 RepID=UPI003014037C|nr:hypothetical protein SH412_005072 [Planctomycetaceae bacterium SH412]